ncbi:MAG: hypothetical protein MZV65_27285 [Chromatiales bacterium]|nr:hypothetical protein [Chromatiales bacterium]
MTSSPKDGATSAPTKRARRGIRLDSKLNRPPLDFAAVGTAARGRWTWILTTLGVDPAHLDGKHRPCPGCGGTDRFRFDDKDDGRWICSQGGGERAYGDGFELLGHVHGWTHAESLHRVAELLGLSDEARALPAAPPPKPSTPSAKPDKAAAQAKAAETARAKWEQLHPAETTHPYLARKGLTAAFGARIDTKGDLVLPLHDEQGRVQSLQHIPQASAVRSASCRPVRAVLMDATRWRPDWTTARLPSPKASPMPPRSPWRCLAGASSAPSQPTTWRPWPWICARSIPSASSWPPPTATRPATAPPAARLSAPPPFPCNQRFPAPIGTTCSWSTASMGCGKRSTKLAKRLK